MAGDMKVSRLSRGKIWTCYTLLFICVGLVIFSQFLIYNKTLIWTSDGYLQWYAIFAKFKQVVSDFFLGNGFSFWSWDTGLGADLIANYALVLCDPFSYLAVFFPNQCLDVAYTVIVILKMYAAGIAMLGFVRYHGKRTVTCLLCAIGYAFCAWSITCLRHDFFMNQLILFPLLIWGVDRIDDRKSPAVLILSVMASVVTSLYFSYMSAAFVFLYIVLKYFTGDRERSVKDFAIRIVKYIGYAVIGGVLLAGPVLLPVLEGLLGTSTSSGVDMQILPNLKQLLRFVPAMAGNYDVNANYSILGMNILFVLMIPAMILLWKKRKISILMFFLSALFAIFPLMQSVLNGFSYPSGRWCYAFCFFFVYAASDCLEENICHTEKYKKGVYILAAVIFFGSICAGVIGKAISITELLIVLVNLVFGAVMFVMMSGKERRYRKKLFWAAIANIAIIPFLSFSPNIGNALSVYMTQGACYDIYESVSLKAASSIEDKDFYRVDTVDHAGSGGETTREVHTPANSGIYWQVPVLYEYLSTIDKSWIDFNQMLVNSAGAYRRMCVYSNDNRSRLDFLMGVRYFLGDDKNTAKRQSDYAGYGFQKEKTEKGINILKAPYEAGLGYVYDTIIPESEFMPYSALEKEQLLMQGAVVQDKDAGMAVTKKAVKTELQTETKPVSATIRNEKNVPVGEHSFMIGKKNEKLTIEPAESVKESEVYLVLKNFRKEPLTPEKEWSLQVENASVKDDALSRAGYFSRHLSYVPYGTFSVYISNTVNQTRKRVLNAEGENQAIRDNKDYMVNLGYFNTFDGKIICQFAELGKYNFDSIEVVAVPVTGFREQAAELTKNRLEVKVNNGDYIKGSVNTEKGGMLYLSILYHPGWKIYIDGVRAEKIYRVNEAFTGCEISAGNHKVELIYRPLGYPYTLGFFAIGILIFAGLVLYHKKKEKK